MRVYLRQFKDLAEKQEFMFLDEVAKREINEGRVRTFVKVGFATYHPKEIDLHYYIGDERLLVALRIEDPK